VARRFTLRLGLVVAVGLAVRLAYLWFSRKGTCNFTYPADRPPGCAGDSYVYHWGARLLAEGKGFIVPTDYIVSGGTVHKAGADHPPLYLLVLGLVSWLGAKTWLAHEYVSVVIGTASVAVAGLLGRDVAGERTGLFAAGAVALYPYVWVNDALVLSEGLSILLVLVVVWLAYRFWHRPSWTSAGALGVAVGAVGLTRAEGLLLGPILVLPLALRAAGLSWRDRFGRLAVAAVAAGATVAPWAIYNLTRFDNPVTLSTGFGITLANTNCDDTYHGPGLGYWSFRCIGALPWTQSRDELGQLDDAEVRQLAEWADVTVPRGSTTGAVIDAILAKGPTADQSDDELFLRHKGMAYIRDHERRVPTVVAARLGRVWNLYRPTQMTHLDVDEGRPLWASRLGLATFYPVVLLAAAGVVVLWRRRIPVWPLVAPAVIVTIATAITFGQTRYRTTTEGALAVLAGVALAALVPRRLPRPRQRAGLSPAGGVQPPTGSA
jgi:hypothetical protein